MDQTVEDRIRTRAYLIWLEEGQPHGKDTEHWSRAEAEVAVDGGAASAKPKRATARRSKKAETPADAAAAPAEAAPKKTPRARSGGKKAATAAAAEPSTDAATKSPKRTATRRKKTPES